MWLYMINMRKHRLCMLLVLLFTLNIGHSYDEEDSIEDEEDEEEYEEEEEDEETENKETSDNEENEDEIIRTGPIVAIADGLVRGTTKLSTREGKEIYSFHGIPYAVPPVEDLRFKDPLPIKPWDGILEAHKDKPRCAQRTHPERKFDGSEDCLYLNVYTTRLLNGTLENIALWDVIFLLHAGGFSYSSGNSVDYCPDNLLDKDVVLVAPNYRLNALGFLATGDKFSPGNYGLKDQVEALNWVQRNIINFGGNPKKVTIFGNHAGAVSAHFHMLSPMSAGLFNAAISQSGTALTPWALLSTESARERAFKLGELVGCRKNELKDSKSLINCLQRKEASDIVKESYNTFERVTEIAYPFVPVIEPEIPGVTQFLPQHPAKLMESLNEGKHIPWLVGIATHEGLPQALETMVFPAVMDGLNDETAKFLLQFLCMDIKPAEKAFNIAQQIWEFYFHNDTLEYSTIVRLADLVSDYHYFYGVLKSVNVQGTVNRSPIFVYEFSYDSRESFMALGIPQGDDREFIFPNIVAGVKLKLREEDINFFEKFRQIFINFARDGDPTKESFADLDNFQWPVAAPGDLEYVSIGKEWKIKREFYTKRMNFWKEIDKQLQDSDSSSTQKNDHAPSEKESDSPSEKESDSPSEKESDSPSEKESDSSSEKESDYLSEKDEL